MLYLSRSNGRRGLFLRVGGRGTVGEVEVFERRETELALLHGWKWIWRRRLVVGRGHCHYRRF